MTTRIEKTDLARDALYDKVNTMIDEVNTKIDNKDSLPSQTGNAGKFLTTDGTNASWGEVKQIEIKQNLTNPSADTVPSTKAVSDESSRIVSIMDTKITNCITYIPQDIKLELNNGILTLKAGSKLYIPNGFESDGTTKKFDVKIIESDKVWSSRNLNYPQQFVFLKSSQEFEAVGESGGTVYSGSTAPSGKQFMLWYDTTNNFVKWTNDSGSSWISGNSFPLSICSSTQENNWVSIDQVFNGFGYIGSTVFALPGVKGLIPNGRNADGSLKNIEFTLNEVRTFTDPYFVDGELIFGINVSQINNAFYRGYKYNEKENFNLYNNIAWDFCFFAKYTAENGGKITSFTPKTVFHALDYNDKSTISGWSMPSSRYINLTLGASGTTYTAPANGYFYIVKVAGNDMGEIRFSNKTKDIVQEVLPKVSTNWIYVRMEAQKGDVFEIVYNATGDTKKFRFIYAEGEPYNPVSSSGGGESGGQVPDLE